MGGRGSTRWADHKKARLVEDCLALDTRWLVREGIIGPNISQTRRIAWGEKESVQLTIETGELEGEASLDYQAEGNLGYAHTLEVVRLVTTHGGKKWWWICPAHTKEESCGQRVAILYFPPGGKRFGCRSCHNLTYRKSQESRMLSFEQKAQQRLTRQLMLYADLIRDDHDLRVLLQGIKALDAEEILAAAGR